MLSRAKTQLHFNRYMRAGTVGKNYSNILVLLLRLRQCCCHPHLITDFEQLPPAGVDSVESMELASSLSPDVVARILDAEGFEVRFIYASYMFLFANN
jgi:SNF2 family DNA or RNA helicase